MMNRVFVVLCLMLLAFGCGDDLIKAPTNLQASVTAPGSIELSWNDQSNNETGLEIERAIEGESFKLLHQTAANVESYRDEDVVQGVVYSYRVRAVTVSLKSGYSNTVTASLTMLAPPENLQSSDVTATSLTLTWEHQSDNETGFEIDRSMDQNFIDAQTFSVAADVLQFDDSGLSSDTHYYYRVRAVNDDMQSEYCAPLAVQTGAPSPSVPAAPSDFGARASASSRIELTWVDNSDNEDGFTLMWSTDGETFNPLYTTEANIQAYTHEGLSAQTTYYYRIQAFNGEGASTIVGPVSATTLTDPDITVSSILTPFDANVKDLAGPSHWTTQYGKSPEIVVASNGTELDILAQDYDNSTAWNAVLLHIRPNANGGYEISQALTDHPMLDRVMGLAIDASGDRYYATGVDEDDVVDAAYPPVNTYRDDIVRVIKLNPAGDVIFNIDLDTARHAHDNDTEQIINPMVAATSRLAVGGNEIALVHGINTKPDDGNIRHQKSLSTRLDATSGAITRTSSVWVSHSFDQRLLYDGQGILEHHLGDAFPRHVLFERNHRSYPLFHIKGTVGHNNTHTRLGNMALIENDATYRYIALFVTESNSDTGSVINGPRNLAIVRVSGSDNSIDPNLPDTLTVTSGGQQHTNRLKWLTNYTDSSDMHAARPKLIGIGGDQYVALWEQWNSQNIFSGVYGMVIDDNGNTIQAAKLITDQHHIHRGDDAFLLDNRAAWMTGNAAEKKLYIHFVDASLNYEVVTLD